MGGLGRPGWSHDNHGCPRTGCGSRRKASAPGPRSFPDSIGIGLDEEACDHTPERLSPNGRGVMHQFAW